ncbi:MAG TPA: hypothetical protein VHV08_04895 [Pirellulales bacterium]|nr:hypothetical protein [Pirellulales bacterium]
MTRLSKWVSLTMTVIVLATGVASFAAVGPAENLLPSNTKGFLSVGSVDQFKAAWNKTQLGELMQDPLMQAFADSFKQQLRQKWLQTHLRLGITWEDLDGVPSGEVGVGLIQVSEKEVCMAIVADVTGHPEQTAALREKLHRNLTSQKAVHSQKNILGTLVTVFDIPKHEEIPARQMAYFVRDDKAGGTLLAAADNLKVIEGILARATETKSDGLANVAAFAAVTKRCLAAAGDLAPHCRWFIEPFGYAESMRVMNDSEAQSHRKGTDMLKILKNQGFTAIEGVGGFVNFSVDKYDILHRTFIYGPGNQASGERFTLAARMLDIPNGGDFAPPDWVPRDVSSYAAMNLNTKNAFESSKTLVNEIVGDEVFEDVLESIKTDENGPRIDIRKELIAYLENRVVIFSDNQLPITPKSERIVFAVPTNNAEKLAVTIQKQMETDEDAKRREINGHVVWEVVDAQTDLPMITIENAEALAGDGADKAADEEPEEKPMLPNSAVTVAFGQLFVATHIDILAKVLASEEQRQKLSTSSDFERVTTEMAKLKLSSESAEMFTRTDDAYRQAYELLRAGRMPEAESMIGKLLNSMLGEGKEGVLRSQRIDGSKLPEFDAVRRYLGPAGLSVTTEGDGWFITGIVLPKQAE